MKFLCIILLLIHVLNLEEWLAILIGELRHYPTHPEHITVPHDIMPIYLGEDPPNL